MLVRVDITTCPYLELFKIKIAMMEGLRVSFEHFLEKFPSLPLPITLGEDTHHHFSTHNEPLPLIMIDQFIIPIESEAIDEFTEFVPCFKLPDTKDFVAIVYWKAALMNYQYILASFTKKGLLIDHKVLAGVYSDGQTVTQSAATILDDHTIVIASGQAPAQGDYYDASSSTTYKMWLQQDGKIVHIV